MHFFKEIQLVQKLENSIKKSPHNEYAKAYL